MSEYSQKLRDPRWQRKRLEILQRDGWACQMCFSSLDTLVVHHRYYDRGVEPWEYENVALVTLCEQCHESEHQEKSWVEASLIRAVRERDAWNDEVAKLAAIISANGAGLCNDGWHILLFHLRKLLKALADPTERDILRNELQVARDSSALREKGDA